MRLSMLKLAIPAMLMTVAAPVLAAPPASKVVPGAETGVVDGPVWEIWYARVDEQKLGSYKKFLGRVYRMELDAWKKAGLIVSYKIFNQMPRDPDDWNLAIALEHKNYAEMDVPGEIFDDVEEKAVANLTDPELLQLKKDKTSWRRVIGSRMMREYVWAK